MTRLIDHKQLEAAFEIVPPPTARSCGDHSFELPPALYIATAALFLGFVTVLTLAFSGHMLVSYGVFAAFIAAFFAVPAIIVRASPQGTRALGWYEFMDKGIATATGRSGALEATVLVLALPFLVFCFAVAVVTIAAVVG